MTLEQQVCNLQLAKKLKELGVKQESLFVWYQSNHSIMLADKDKLFWYCAHRDNNSTWNTEKLSAFTAAELLDMMPGRNKRWDIDGKWSNDWWLRIDQSWAARDKRRADGKMQNTWKVDYVNDDDTPLRDEMSFGENLADQVAELLIYLLEKGLLTL